MNGFIKLTFFHLPCIFEVKKHKQVHNFFNMSVVSLTILKMFSTLIAAQYGRVFVKLRKILGNLVIF